MVFFCGSTQIVPQRQTGKRGNFPDEALSHRSGGGSGGGDGGDGDGGGPPD